MQCAALIIQRPVTVMNFLRQYIVPASVKINDSIVYVVLGLCIPLVLLFFSSYSLRQPSDILQQSKKNLQNLQLLDVNVTKIKYPT